MADSDLGSFITEVTGESHLRVEDDYGDGFVRLKTAEAERRQAKHDIRSSEDVLIELLRNARDAHARTVFVATAREGSRRVLTVIDDGDGVPDRMREKIFEARVTNKLDTVHMDTWGIHGRGMALYAISVNAVEARVAATQVNGGSSFFVATDVNRLPEKTDQSTKPVFVRTESGTVTVRGPRNLYRTAAEFAYIERGACTVYLGSPIEIAAALWDFGCSLVPPSTRAFCKDIESLPVCKRLALASEPHDFAQIAGSMGLELSERSARRIMDGQIATLAPLAEQVSIVDANERITVGRKPSTGRGGDAASSAEGKEEDGRARIERVLGQGSFHVKLADSDLDGLARAVARAWAPVADSYYLDSKVDISAQVRGDQIRIAIPLRPRGE